jgi:hypothetical protein
VRDAVKLAVELHRRGEVENAAKRYQEILAVVPDQADALHFLRHNLASLISLDLLIMRPDRIIVGRLKRRELPLGRPL